jgi:tetratricopeptide (TPR) repeat protein
MVQPTGADSPGATQLPAFDCAPLKRAKPPANLTRRALQTALRFARGLLHGLLMALLFGSIAPATAQEKPVSGALAQARERLHDAPADLWLALSERDYPRALSQLAQMESRWAMDASYNALLAETALAARDYAQASLALERLVLLEPNNAGAWLDLAVASEALGDLSGAQRALAELERGFTVPAGVRPIVASLRKRIAYADKQPGLQWQLRAATYLGRDSNANGGLLVNTLTLTPALASIELPVDPAFLPRGSNLWLASLESTGRWNSAYGPLEARARVSEKHYTSEPDYNTLDAALTVAGQLPGLKKAYWLADWRRIDMGAGLLTVDIPRFSLSADLPWGFSSCEPSVGTELEARSYRQQLAIYDARIFWLGFGLRCPVAGGRLAAALRGGVDRAVNDRPGGDSRRVELGATWQRLISPGLELTVGLLLANGADSQGYSPLIENNAARQIRRRVAHAQLAWDLQPRWQLVGRIEQTRQDSNIGLFGLEQAVAMVGLVYQTP